MADLKAFAEQLVNLTVKEVNELAQILKDEYGIEPAAAAVAVAAPAAGADAPAAEEKTSFDVILKSAGAQNLDFLATIKSKNELIADLVALLQSPAKNVISALQSGGNTIHGVLQTLGERAE